RHQKHPPASVAISFAASTMSLPFFHVRVLFCRVGAEFITVCSMAGFLVEDAPDSANQAPPLTGYNAWSGDRILGEAVEREGGGWISARASEMGELVGSERMQLLASQANRYVPELRTHDRFGARIDSVEYHPAYHELMGLAFGAGLHSLAWTDPRPG